MSQQPEILVGTVTQANPPRVRTDGASNDSPAVACSGVQAVIGARGTVVRAGKLLYLTAVAASDTAYVPAQVTGAAAPTTDTWSRGDICWNTAPASAGYVGFVCTVAGSPGTWKGFGLIA